MHHHHPPAAPTATTSAAAQNNAATSTSNTATTSASVLNGTSSSTTTTATQQRRRKKRPNYGTRTVEVRRGYNGFGFTISGQQPCRLSCIIKNSPADQAGLRAGDFLISVNGLNVSKLAHETVVQLIGSISSIRMQIAENYYSDSSDEENANALLLQQIAGYAGIQNSPHHLQFPGGMARVKPRFHKTKMHRLRNSPQKKRIDLQQIRRAETHNVAMIKPEAAAPLRPLLEDVPLPLQSASVSGQSSSTNNAVPKPAAPPVNVSADVANVSAMVRVPTAALEYRAIVGYLGTIEMPKQISNSSKLQTVRSCIRKLRQEKRQPTTVLMTILPDSLKLQAANGNVLATYASARLNYVSSSSESENRFFGLVTSAVHTTPIDEDDDDDDDVEANGADMDDMAIQNAHNDGAGVRRDAAAGSATGHISISNSCHVFVVDTKLCEHPAHLPRANEFRIQCTRDPISNLCLEFPNNSEYVVNLIRSMYTMRILPPATRAASLEEYANGMGNNGGNAVAHSPQPSNHSEISTTTSNSDSGIGFHNDCNNISDRILVVDFPNAPHNFPAANVRPPLVRPLGIFNNLNEAAPPPQPAAAAAASTANDKRLTVRAMPDPKTPTTANPSSRRPNLLASFNLIQSPANSLNATRSCDDMLALVERANFHDSDDEQPLMPHASLDELSLHTATTSTLVDDNAFLHPDCLARPMTNYNFASDDYKAADLKRNARHSLQLTANAYVPDKLSPKVFGVTPTKAKPSSGNSSLRLSLGIPSSVDFVEPYQPNSMSIATELDTWSSLQNLYVKQVADYATAMRTLEATNSEPDLGNRALPANASPFRRAWAQSSLRTPRSDKSTQPAQFITSPQHFSKLSPHIQRSASMRASDNDVYIKSMGGFIDELKQTHSQQQLPQAKPAQILTKIPQIKTDFFEKQQLQQAQYTGPPGVAGWAASFERMLDEPAGLQTFAEFLKKEFSAENIYFWTACERFRQTELLNERVQQAQAIFDKHLANSASDPVNVDSRARKLTEERLASGERDIFAAAQKQIFNLMKFDSFPRFLRSDLYKSCVDAEQKQQPLPYKAEDLEELLKTNFQQLASSKLKKSASNAEDRRRKSLLPWHRKTRSKSRDREGDDHLKLAPIFATPLPCTSKLPQLSSSSLKIPSTHNSVSDLHSSRSSLSSFDAPTADNACSLCRVILSDGATTIVQTRHNETIGQLVERLLEKRGLSYQFYDVVANGNTKSIDLQLPSHTIAGKEVLIEQRVAFKLDLPDPKVISVKSKPKKQLHEVIRPILQKYNYNMDAVQVLMRDTQTLMDLSLPVTVADGQRLQIVMLPPASGVVAAAVQNYQNGQYGQHAATAAKSNKVSLPKSVTFPCNVAKQAANIAATRNGIPTHTTCPTTTATTTQSTLDEITNKVFSELLQGKVESNQQQQTQQKPQDLCSLKSDDCASETSSIFERMRRRDSNIPALKVTKTKKKSVSSQHSEDNSAATATATTPATSSTSLLLDLKKPIIAKLKAGVKLQLTERVAETQDELLEGLKRAQLARLEDQRGTEINFELPEFLKNKENLSAAASKLRKARANLSPISKPSNLNSSSASGSMSTPTTPMHEYPQPAPRLSLTQKPKSTSLSPMRLDEEPATANHAQPSNSLCNSNSMDTSTISESNSAGMDEDGLSGDNRGPPPLPPKPKVLPIKPSNWGVNAQVLATLSSSCGGVNRLLTLTPNALTTLAVATSTTTTTQAASKIPIDITRKLNVTAGTGALPATTTTRCAYLEEPSSSFV